VARTRRLLISTGPDLDGDTGVGQVDRAVRGPPASETRGNRCHVGCVGEGKGCGPLPPTDHSERRGLLDTDMWGSMLSDARVESDPHVPGDLDGEDAVAGQTAAPRP
jgi:hypothetical protein